MELKYKLLNDLFIIGNNYSTEKLVIAELKLQEYFKDNKNDFQIRDALTILKVFETEYKYNDLETCCKLSAPIFERLNNTPEWDFYDIRILTSVVQYADTYAQSQASATKLLELLENHSHEKRYIFIKMAILINMTSRLLRARFYENDTPESYEDLSALFSKYINLIMPLCENENFIDIGAMARVREGIFYKDIDLINNTFKFLKEEGKWNLYKILQDEFREYKYYVEFDKISKRQFNEIIGKNVRKLRNGLDMSMNDFAEILGLTVATISLIERGERAITSYSIFKLSEALELPIGDFYHGTDAVMFDSPTKEVLLEQINVMARTFRDDQLKCLIEIARGIVKLTS